jgi:hypothetical protein
MSFGKEYYFHEFFTAKRSGSLRNNHFTLMVVIAADSSFIVVVKIEARVAVVVRRVMARNDLMHYTGLIRQLVV